MRIAINAVNMNSNPRGPDRYLTELLKGLAQVDDRNTYLVFHAPWQKWFHAEIDSPRIELIEVRPPRTPYLRFPWQALVFPKIVRRYQPDIVHLPNTLFVPRRGFKLVVTIHDLAEFDFPEKFSRFRAAVRRRMVRASVRAADCVVAVSEYTRQEMLRRLPVEEDKIRVVLEGVDITPPENVDCEAVRRTYRLGENYFLYVGVLERTKNIDGILRAFAKVRHDLGSDYSVVLVGHPGNAHREILDLIQELDLVDSVRYLGYLSEAHLGCVFLGAKAFVFPSLVEGFGLVMVESMAYGLPVIASLAGSLPEVAGDAALLVEPLDEEALGDAMRRIASDPQLRASLREKGLRRAAQFSWVRAAEEMVEIFESLGGPNRK